MIEFTGDIHGAIDIHKLGTSNWYQGAKRTKADYLIVAGDFGLIWDESEKELYWRDLP